MQDHRRQFLRAAATTSAAAVAGNILSSLGAATAAALEPLPIIDTHQHLWDLEAVRPPWVKTAPPILAKRYATEEYKTATAGLNVVKAVYMEVDVAPKDQIAEAHRVIELSRSDDHPTAAAVISGRPNSAAFGKYIRQFADSGYIKGVRQVLHVDETPAGFCLQEQFGKSMSLLGELDKSFDICIRPTELGDAAKLVRQHPDTKFILDHCGNADPKSFLAREQQTEKPWHEKGQWTRGIDDLAKCENLVCKISGIVARAPKGWKAEQLAPIINHCLDSFGPDRVIFGGDWPVCLLGSSYSEWVVGLKEVISNRPLEQQKKLLYDNAERIYGLGRAS